MCTVSLRARVAFSLCLLGLTLVGGCAPLRAPARGVISDVPVYALLADNQLLAVRADSGVLVARRLAPTPPPATWRFVGHDLVFSRDGATLYALAPGFPGTDDRVAVVDAPTAAVRSTFSLPGQGVYRGLALGPVTDRVYVFGTRDGSAIVTVLDPQTGRILDDWVARPLDGPSWDVYQGAVSADERRIYLSYHGEKTTGIDWFALDANGLHRCTPPRPVFPSSGCIPTHGGFVLHGNGLLAATGTNVVLDVGPDGMVRRAFDTKLNGNHLMEFTVDAASNRLYAVGSCGYAGGLSSVDLGGGGILTTPTSDGEWRWRATPEPSAVRALVPPEPGIGDTGEPCGQRIVVAPSGQLVIAKLPIPDPRPGIPGALLFLDPTTGRVTRTVVTPAEPVDVVAAR